MLYTSAAALFLVGGYHRLKAARTGEPLDRRQEGWPLLLGIRLTGLALAITIYRAAKYGARPAPSLQWAGTVLFVLTAIWLIWMFRSLGTNLTDTVVTRRAAKFVCHGPYKYVRNPMYVGILSAGFALALILGNGLVAILTLACFVQLAIRTRIEERFLIARFGETYKSYMSKVGRFWPYMM
jgi:protein-S-isoprenylcysteine O-methyltransferase Ste14